MRRDPAGASAGGASYVRAVVLPDPDAIADRHANFPLTVDRLLEALGPGKLEEEALRAASRAGWRPSG